MQPKLRIPAATLLSVLGSAYYYCNTSRASSEEPMRRTGEISRAGVCFVQNSPTGMYYNSTVVRTLPAVCCIVLITLLVVLYFVSWIMKHRHRVR